MKNYDCHNNIICPSTAKKLLDSNITTVSTNSSFPIDFTLYKDLKLPKKCKIEVLETRLQYNISKIEKELLINGKCVDSHKFSLHNCIDIKDIFINLAKDNHNKILFNMMEYLKLEISLILEFKAIAHTDSCGKIYFEAIGKSKDYIETLLMSHCCIPVNCNLDNIYIEIDHCLNTKVNPNHIFLSPIYDCQSNINSLLGNVFINYEILIDLICYKKIRKYSYNPFPHFRNNYYEEYIHFN
ncbi:hypothetical protein [Terrisporobacter hibernicus]|uniref:Uncharacterized protein n=1 Tax=Terrisporobacter hibernicus TaxID=2813371 RepID=A0AAX2ZJ19_9FIRM|nr:hypothetical protein [Terrisporobacter hibernicus]UEL48821.1 hypothetical protein JW646_05055 [Terrisporobacter hibernicus]